MLYFIPCNDKTQNDPARFCCICGKVTLPDCQALIPTLYKKVTVPILK